VGPLLIDKANTHAVGRQLFAATAELCRTTGFALVDAGRHDLAQRYLIQALRLARAAGDVSLGGYVLATMALQTLIRGYPDEAIDMAQGATQRAGAAASPRTTAFYTLIEARAHAAAGDRRATEHALLTCERHLANATPEDTPHGLTYMTHERLAADAAEAYRDLRIPGKVHYWDRQAQRPTRYTRSAGLHALTVASAHLQAGQLDEGLHRARHALTLLTNVTSHRCNDYLRTILNQLHRWGSDHRATEFRRDASTLLTA
jgi:tetratricopeptide (TPR) repeat protein